MLNFDYLSFGAGVQTTALLFLYKEGKINFKKAIFADTKAETKDTYRLMKKLNKLFPDKIVICSSGNITKDSIREKYITAPVYSSKTSKGRRSCTYRYKIYPVAQKIRELENWKGKRLKPNSTTVGLGFSTDEFWRAKESRTKWIKNIFPLLTLKLSRKDCLDILKRHGINEITRSACFFCPLRSDKEWLDMKKNNRREWKKAVAFDRKIRDLKPDRKNFVHRSGKPLDKAELENPAQMNLFALNDCESGYCGT